MGQRVLIVGGSGVFGRRLVNGLVATTEHEVVIAARNLLRAHVLADEMNAGTSASQSNGLAHRQASGDG
jgi:uncharacterized protein YbjT (DUF2867 family)